jgi:hypothetical protein
MRVTLEYVRPNTEVQWPCEIMPDWAKTHIKETYKDTNQMINEEIIISDDGLTLLWRFYWIENPALVGVWIQDETVLNWRHTRDTYCSDNGIIKKDTKVKYFDIELQEEIELIWND